MVVQKILIQKFLKNIQEGVHHCVRSPRLTHWKTDFYFRPRGGGVSNKNFFRLGHK